MSGARVFVTRALPGRVLEELRAAPEVGELVVSPHDRPATRAELLAGAAGCQALVCQLVDRIDAELLAAAPALRVVASYSVGLDHVDVAAASARGVAVTHTPGVLTEATADLTWALILAVSRRVVEGDRLLRAGGWPGWSPGFLLGADVSGRTLGLVGLGRIGQAVARRARGFGMRLLWCGPRDKPEAAELGAERVAQEELLRQSDFVSLHAWLGAGTRHLIGESGLRTMRPSAFLINTSRGSLVDEAALVRALREGWIAGAGLDVYEREPRLEAGLAEQGNAVLLPHLGSSTHATREAMGRLVVANLRAVLGGQPPPACVNPEVLPRSAGG